MSGGWGTKSRPVSPLPPLSSPLSPPLFLSVNEAQFSPEHKNRDLSSYHGLGFFRPVQNSGCSWILQASVTPFVGPSGWILTFFLHLCSFLFFSSCLCHNSLVLILLVCFSLCLSTAGTKGTTNRSDFTLCFTIHRYRPCAHLLGMFFQETFRREACCLGFPMNDALYLLLHWFNRCPGRIAEMCLSLANTRKHDMLRRCTLHSSFDWGWQSATVIKRCKIAWLRCLCKKKKLCLGRQYCERHDPPRVSPHPPQQDMLMMLR